MATIRRRVALLGLVLLVSGSVACVGFGEAGVRNATGEPIRVAPFSEICDTAGEADRVWKEAAPGETVGVFVLYGRIIGDTCIVVTRSEADTGSLVVVEHGRLYEATEQAGGLVLTDVGEHDEPWFFNVWKPGVWLLIYAVPFLLGAPFGLYITGKFFYDYYVRKKR